MKIDPYNNEGRWLKWKEKAHQGIPELTKDNSDIILRYLEDMEKGINVSAVTKKGGRSYIRLNALKTRIIFITKNLEQKYGVKDIRELTEEKLLNFFSSMRTGELKTKEGKEYKSVQDYAKIFKAFWHWYEKSSKKQEIKVQDITTDLDTSGYKPEWVYLNEDQVKKLADNAKFEYRVLIMFLFDSGIRSPTELINLKVSDIFNDCKELYIRDEISKTFGRRIKLMICSSLLKDYITNQNFKQEDFLFNIKPYIVNRYLKRLGKSIFGDKESLAGQKYSELTMYDFRHCSCCYWLPRYKSESALKYRFGWKKSEKIHYYSELLGMKDTISEEDLLMDVTKTEIEKRLTQSENEKERLKERIQALESQMQKILQHIDKMNMKIEV